MKEPGDGEEAMKAAIRYCREHGILKEFLENHAGEVLNMLLEEYTVEDAMALMRKESLEEGLEQGREEGREEAVRNLLKYGMSPEQAAEALRISLETVTGIQGRIS
ncbi:MAG: hypothetical protein LBI91_01830, partial [Spirochaetaceae bacterium]|nr:hypothetical protein [Spirochaetaceae bacterium]